MKISLLLQRQFAYIGHYVTQTLQTDHGLTDFNGYVFMRSSLAMLQAQKDVRYSTLLLDQELHKGWETEVIDPAYLSALEKRIGLPSLWPFLIADRVIMQQQLVREYPHDQLRYSHTDLLKMLQVRAKAIDAFFEREKPDVAFGIPPGALGAMLYFHLAKVYGARTLYVVPSNLQRRYVLTEDYRTFTGVDAIFRTQRAELLASEDGAWARAFLTSYRSRPLPNFVKTNPTDQRVTRAQQWRFLNPAYAIGPLREILRSYRRHLTDIERGDYDYIHPFWQTVDLVKRKLRNLRGNDDLYDRFDPNENYVFFPLHVEPELSLLVLAPAFSDQLQLIKQIARALPVQMTLCVKEHPAMARYRSRAFYKALKKIPNVKLLPPTITGFDVTTHAKLVTTITGTVGWEACLFGVPVVSFGHQNFNALSNVTPCYDLDALPQVIRERLDHPRYDEDEVIAYLAALHRTSIEINLQQLWEEETNQEKRRAGVKPLADALAAAIQRQH